jgi:hypothetical protein
LVAIYPVAEKFYINENAVFVSSELRKFTEN